MQVRILLSLLVALFGVFLFGSGFFQVPLLSSSFHIPSLTTTSNNAPLHPYESTFSAAPHPTTSFRRVVFLLIDALRPDMINSQDMPQTYNLLQTADAWASTVASPGGLVQGTSSATLHDPPRFPRHGTRPTYFNKPTFTCAPQAPNHPPRFGCCLLLCPVCVPV